MVKRWLSLVVYTQPFEGGDGGSSGGDGGSGGGSGAGGGTEGAGSGSVSGGSDGASGGDDGAGTGNESAGTGGDGSRAVDTGKLLDAWRGEQKRQQQVRRQEPSRGKQKGEGQGSEEKPLTRSQIDQILAERERNASVKARNDRLTSELEGVVTSPTSYGDVQVVYASEEEVRGFRDFVKETAKNGLTGAQINLLHNIDRILKMTAQSAVKKYQSSLKPGVHGRGSSKDSKVETKPGGNQQTGRRPRVPSIQDFIRQESPELADKMDSGDMSVFG